MKELWNETIISLRYESRDADNPSQRMRTYNEHWEFNDNGLMCIRDMNGNDYLIQESERRYR
jgi:nuclear transport factor 2 (NTF2) superfamily protein